MFELCGGMILDVFGLWIGVELTNMDHGAFFEVLKLKLITIFVQGKFVPVAT